MISRITAAGGMGTISLAKGKGKRKRKRKHVSRDREPAKKKVSRKEPAAKPAAARRRKAAAPARKRKPRQVSSNWLERSINNLFAWWDAQGYDWRDYFRMGLLAGGLLVVLYYAFSAGGYFLIKRGYGELIILYLVVLGLLFGLRAGGRLPRMGMLELAFFGGYTLWVLLSITWSYKPAASLDEFVRANLYLAGYGLFYLYMARREWLTWLGHLFIIIAFIIALDSVFGKIGIVEHPDPFQTNRLSYPLTYWNTMGILMIMAFPLALRVLADRATYLTVRCLYAPALVLFITVLFFTFSRAGLLLLMLVFGLYLLVAVLRLRAVLQAAIAAVWTMLIIIFSYLFLPTMVQLIPNPDAGEAKLFGLLLLVVMLLAIAPQVLIYRQEQRISFSEDASRKIGMAVAGTAVLLLLLGSTAFFIRQGTNPVSWVQGQLEVISEPEAVTTSAGERLLSLQSERYKEYAVSVGVLRDNPLKGTGAGTWSIHWLRERPREIQVKDGHSWLFETMAELGLVGTFLVLGFIITFIVRCISDLRFLGRTRQREIYGAFFTACVAFMIHATIDWDWEMAVVTLSFFMFAGGLLRYGALSRAGTTEEAEAAAAVGDGAASDADGWSPHRLLSWNWLIGTLCVLAMLATIFPLVARNRVESATRLAGQGEDYVTVGMQAKTAHRFNPLDGEALILMAVSAQKAGDVDEAERLILLALDLEPYNDKFYRNLTRIYLAKANAAQDPEEKLDYTAKAVDAIRKSRELNPLESKDTGPLEEEVRKLTGGAL